MLVRFRAMPFDTDPMSGYGYGPTLTSSVVALGLAWLRDDNNAGAVGVVQGFFAVD
jgi:hypothetical protein